MSVNSERDAYEAWIATAERTPAQETSSMSNESRIVWFTRLKALDNLLALHSLKRHAHVYAGGFLVFHTGNPKRVRWIDVRSSEESWLEDVKLLEE